MSKAIVQRFINYIKNDFNLQSQFNVKSLSEVVFHAKILGFNFTQDELISAIGDREINIVKERKEEFNARFSLWIPMWGKYFFTWVLEDVFGEDKKNNLNSNYMKGSMDRMAVVDFFLFIKDNYNLKNVLRIKLDSEIVKIAEKLNYKFTAADLTDIVWDMEIFLSKKLNEKFDDTFSLWKTMWGKYYFDYIIDNIIKSLTDKEMRQIAKNGV
ncbi:MAG: Nif11-like leader peptide family natural product precursor [Spirochaetota bacterium]|nr:Nif11-like leader peptide family natural product precursor [Spirochaetota bacterium]